MRKKIEWKDGFGCGLRSSVCGFAGTKATAEWRFRRLEMSILPPVILTTTQLVGGLVASAKNALDLAKASSDHELKGSISELYDSLLDVKARVLDLDDENRVLKQRLEQAANIRRDEVSGYWFKDGETSPLCPKCYEGSRKAIYLPASEPWNGGVRRDCRVCQETYWEKPMDLSIGSIRPHVSRY